MPTTDGDLYAMIGRPARQAMINGSSVRNPIPASNHGIGFSVSFERRESFDVNTIDILVTLRKARETIDRKFALNREEMMSSRSSYEHIRHLNRMIEEWIGANTSHEVTSLLTDPWRPPELLYSVPRPHSKATAARAWALLKRFLTQTQRDQLVRLHYFEVVTATRGTIRLHNRPVNNIEEISTGRFYCAGPDGMLPIGDFLLGQKLALEVDAEALFRVANLVRIHVM